MYIHAHPYIFIHTHTHPCVQPDKCTKVIEEYSTDMKLCVNFAAKVQICLRIFVMYTGINIISMCMCKTMKAYMYIQMLISNVVKIPYCKFMLRQR